MTGDFPPDILKLAESVVDRGYHEGLVDAVARVLSEQIERDAVLCETSRVMGITMGAAAARLIRSQLTGGLGGLSSEEYVRKMRDEDWTR